MGSRSGDRSCLDLLGQYFKLPIASQLDKTQPWQETIDRSMDTTDHFSRTFGFSHTKRMPYQPAGKAPPTKFRLHRKRRNTKSLYTIADKHIHTNRLVAVFGNPQQWFCSGRFDQRFWQARQFQQRLRKILWIGIINTYFTGEEQQISGQRQMAANA